jgi:hypothetical protein
LVACVGASCGAGPAGGGLLAEIDRLDAALTRLEGAGLPEGLRRGLPGARSALAAVRATPDEDLALYRLRQPFVDVGALSFLVEHRAAGEDLAGLEALSRREGAAHAEVAAAAKPALRSALHRALHDAAQNRAARLYAAALPYGRVAGPSSGLYYLGEARAHLLYGDLVARRGAAGRNPPAEPPPDADALGATLARLDEETVAAFGRDPGAPTMIAVSARLKEAHELLDGGRLPAAMLTVLEGRLALSRRLAGPSSDEGGAAAAAEVTSATAPAAQRSSLRDLFVAMAEAESDPATARLIRRDVLPLHDSLLGSSR